MTSIDHRHSSHVLACAAILGIAAAEITMGQTCMLNETARLLAPSPASSFYEFGSAITAQGDRALVAGGTSNLGSYPGTVHALQRVRGAWSITQAITSPDASNTDQFGASVAISGDWAIIGAPQEDPGGVNNGGAAYLYTSSAGVWTFHGRITPGDPSANKQFARVVDIDGDIVVASAANDNEGGVSSAGAAYVFRFNGTAWVQEQKILEAAPAPLRRFGTAVAVDDGTVLIAAVPSGTPGATSGVHVYRHNGATWQSMQILHSPAFPAQESFGAALRIDGDTFAAGAVPNGGIGHVYTFEFDGANWAFDQSLAGPTATPDGNFGHAFDLQGDRLIAGAPFRDAPTYPLDFPSSQAGLGFLYERPGGGGGGAWALRWTLRSRPRLQDDFFYQNRGDQLGMAAALTDADFIVGATTPNTTSWNTNEFGHVAVYPLQPPDCDSDGLPDACEIDCNANNTSDECEIAQAPARDCDLNGQLDVCQVPAEYIADNGFGSAVWGSFVQELDMIWMNQYRVTAGAQRITHVALPWTLFTSPDLPLTILLYDDPNNDGDPSDAALLSTSPAVTPDPPGGLSTLFTIHQVQTTLVGEIGESFFVGAAMSLPLENGAAVQGNPANSPVRSWRGTAAFGQININTPTANPTFVATSQRLLVRAYGLDCNGNGLWDDCDIASGFSLDANGNGLPDECEAECPADIVPSGTVDIDDLLAVIGAWGLCPKPPPAFCIGDIAPPDEPNGVVNIDDLLAVISAWGDCP